MSMFDDVLGMGRTSSIIEGAIEPELEEITMESVADIPSYMDPMEFMTQVACEQELNMQRLDMAILAEEYVYLRENGVEMVEESAVDTALGLVKKCQEGIMRVWEKIQSFFKMVQTKLREADKRDELFIKAYKEKAIAGGTVKVKVNAVVNSSNLQTINTNAKGFYTNTIKAANDIYAGARTNDKESKDLVAEALRTIFGEKVTDQNSTAKAILKQMVKDAKDTKKQGSTVDVEMKPEDACNEFLGAKDLKNDLKDSYNKSKKIINTLLKSAKGIEGTVKKKKVLPTDESKKVHQSVKAISAVQKILVQTNKTEVKLFNMRKAMLKKIILASAAQGSKKIGNGAAVSKDISAATGKYGGASNIQLNSASFIESVQLGEEW